MLRLLLRADGEEPANRPGHPARLAPEIYSRLALADAQQRYNDVIGQFPSH
jgi:hypothetical protein